jgi:phosphate:Na+ symporter
MSIANHLENIGDMVETNLFDVGVQRIGSRVEISAPTRAVLRALHNKVQWAVERAILALVHEDTDAATEVIEAKESVNALVDEAERHLVRRLAADEPDRLPAFKVESEIVEHLKRVYYFAKRIAKAMA